MTKHLLLLAAFFAFHLSALASPYCTPDANGNYNDAVTSTKGQTDDYSFGEGGACVLRPILDAWGATHNTAFMIWGGITSGSVAKNPIPPTNFTHSYDGTYIVENPFPLPDVDWTMEWLHKIADGSIIEPKKVVVTYRKYKGTSFISSWQGTITLEFVTPTVTAVTVRDEINASRTGPDDAEGTVRALVNKVKTLEPNSGALQP